MIISMTGYGRSRMLVKKMDINVELRSVNNKYLEVSSRLPVIFSDKENEIKELVKNKISRGKINVSVSIDRNSLNNINLHLSPENVKSYYNLLKDIKSIVKSKEEIKIEHLLKFSEIFKVEEDEEIEKHWGDVVRILDLAIKDLCSMKKREGKILEKDILNRVNFIGKKLGEIVKLSNKNLKQNKEKLEEKVNELIYDSEKVDYGRVELELVLLADKLDITEEVVRAKAHISYFKNNIRTPQTSGRKLNFLIQELNREINTIASKSNNSKISQFVVEIKEELEKIKEQLQNVE